MRGFQVKVVSRTVHINRQQINPAKPILLAVGLELNQEHLLRQPIGSVGLLRVAVPQILLLKRHRRVLRIGTDRACTHKLLHTTASCFLDDLDAHHSIVIERLPRGSAVGTDAADNGRQVNNQVRAYFVKEMDNCSFLPQVVLPTAGHDNLLASALPQLFNYVRAEEASSSSDNDSFFLPKIHSSPPGHSNRLASC